LFLRICARHSSPEAADTHAKWRSALLKRELDVDPEHETVALIEDIRGRRTGIERLRRIGDSWASGSRLARRLAADFSVERTKGGRKRVAIPARASRYED